MQKEICVPNMNSKSLLRKKAQIILFIIISPIIVGFLLLQLWPQIRAKFVKEINRGEYVKSCTEEYLQGAIALASKQGGNVNPIHTVLSHGERMY